MSASYQIKLPQFEGPFDLLLFFIERDEIDIHNIPISGITNDFLDYIRQMTDLNIEFASEFILVAATLMRIKAKMLLPRPELDDEGNEIDPRQALVERLVRRDAKGALVRKLGVELRTKDRDLQLHQRETGDRTTALPAQPQLFQRCRRHPCGVTCSVLASRFTAGAPALTTRS